MIKIFSYILITSLLVFGSSKAHTQDEFIMAVIEIAKSDEPGSFEINIQSAKVIKHKLKRATPSKSNRRNPSSPKIIFRLTNAAHTVLDEIQMDNPLITDFEFVDGEGNLKRHATELEKKSLIIRRPVSSEAMYLEVSSGSYTRSRKTVVYKIERS